MEYVCYCGKVTEGDMQRAIDAGASSLAEVIQITGAMQSRDCQVHNPKGVCCYPDLVAVYAKITKREPIKNDAPQKDCQCCNCNEREERNHEKP